jgi:polyhydroxybutyrate depolymerase
MSLSDMRRLSLFALTFLCAELIATAAEPIPMHWSIAGVERQALVFVPTSTAEKIPVVFAFHGHGGNAQFAARGMDFQDEWPEALVVYMQGLPTPSLIRGDQEGKLPGWQHNPGELGDRDLKFFDAVLATLREKYPVDDRRIYATGFSNGGYFTYLLWSQRPQVFAAFAPGAGTILPSFQLTEPRPVLHFGGRADRLVAFEKQERSIAEARRLNGCTDQGEACGLGCTLYPSSKGAPVETFIHPYGHFFPPAVRPLIVKFFKDHPRSR